MYRPEIAYFAFWCFSASRELERVICEYVVRECLTRNLVRWAQRLQDDVIDLNG